MNTKGPESGRPSSPSESSPGPRRFLVYGLLILGTAVATLIVVAVLVTMFEHKQEERVPFVRVVEVDEVTTDPVPWGQNWPMHFDAYKMTAEGAEYGGSSALTESKLEKQPWLRRLYAGYAFSLDYREARGHAYMLFDQRLTERVTKRSQSGACLHCHASATVMYRKEGLEAMGEPADEEALRASFNMPAVIRGFQEVSTLPYHEVLAKIKAAPDGTPQENEPLFPETRDDALPPHESDIEMPPGEAHPVSCIDCHDPDTMEVRVTRPGFMQGIADLAASDAPVPHMPSIDGWRKGSRAEPYDPNEFATRQEMRSFVCGQCHVEYYCADKMVLTFPWGNGLKAGDIEQYWDDHEFPDGTGFYDYVHGETGAKTYKAQHPEFELWSQGTHGRNGVACADCHMPYKREGAMKLSSHDVRSPIDNLSNACQVCHPVSEKELEDDIKAIQARTDLMLDRAAAAMVDMLDAVLEAKAAGATDEQLARVYELQKKALWRIDFISSENSQGFHADQEAVRILGESIDYSRRAQAEALRYRAPEAPSIEGLPREPVKGVTPSREAPPEPPESAG